MKFDTHAASAGAAAATAAASAAAAMVGTALRIARRSSIS